mmetsp:Transcript_120829/g.287047  ORF Transcript_120829/g.287047 Transcript_120829/m.287047 type:complete len:226 (+) Transcript_120829:246-923(+)
MLWNVAPEACSDAQHLARGLSFRFSLCLHLAELPCLSGTEVLCGPFLHGRRPNHGRGEAGLGDLADLLRDHSNPDAITVRMFPDVQIVGLVALVEGEDHCGHGRRSALLLHLLALVEDQRPPGPSLLCGDILGWADAVGIGMGPHIQVVSTIHVVVAVHDRRNEGKLAGRGGLIATPQASAQQAWRGGRHQSAGRGLKGRRLLGALSLEVFCLLHLLLTFEQLLF